MSLIVINPGNAHGIYQGLSDGLTAKEPPLWTRLIAGYARDRGIKVEIIDADALGWSASDVAKELMHRRPILACICAMGHQPSASTQTMPEAQKIAQAIKWLVRATIVVGGHVAALPGLTLQEEPAFDYSCTGEGPVTVTQLYYALLAKVPMNAVPGLCYRGEAGIYQHPGAPLIKDLDADLHGDVWDDLPMRLYRAHNWQCFGGWPRQPYASIYTTLGCPFKCEFCCINAPFGGNFYRKRSPARIAAEVVKLRDERGVTTFKIIDEMFMLNKAHVLETCKTLRACGTGSDCNFWAYTRIDTMSDEMLEAAREAGIRWLGIGIESGSAHVRDGASKPFLEEDIIKAIEMVRRHDINIAANYIYGLPDDTHETMKQTLSLAMELRTEWSNHYSAMAYPGSKLYGQALKEGWRLPEIWAGYSQHAYETVPLPTATLSSEEVLAFRDKAFTTYFENPAYLHSIAIKFGVETVREIEEMTKVKLKRKILGD
jgi:anaerobic magnesium-protoporphyrin IX monomethyl ester cyclase